MIMDPLVSNYGVPEHSESSPMSSTHQHADWEDPLPQVPGAKLRLMCSYGGHIIPRPHDKTLCYVGGETRIVVAERSASLPDLVARLSKTLLDGRKFTLKYQLPNEDLDSLISVANDDDLENMIDEYDRIAGNNGSSFSTSRIRLFLFVAKPETAQTMGTLFNDAQSENWFVDALNGADALSRGLSESAAVGDLLRLDSDPNMQLQTEFSHNVNQAKIAAHPQDVHSIQSIMSDSPMVETNTSSFDSSTSSPSMAHLPPIRVRGDENNDANNRLNEEMKGGGAPLLEQQFTSQLRVVPPPSTTTTMAHPNYAGVVATTAKVMHRNDSNMSSTTMSDDDGLSDHGVVGPSQSRKPPLPLTLQQRTPGGFNLPSSNDLKNAASGGINLPSPDSVKSDSSIASGVSLTKTTPHQEQAQVTASNENKHSIIHQQNTEQNSDNHISSFQSQNPQLQSPQDPNKYMYPPQQQDQQQQQHQHQFIHENMHYITTHPHLPPSYRPVYATPQQMHPHQGDQQQQYSMYLLPINQTQPYNVAHQLVSNPSMAAHAQQPVYPTGAAAAQANAQYQQYLGYNSNVQPMTGNAVNYGHFDYGHNQVYYTGQLAPPPPAAIPVAAPSQYQSLTPAQAAMIAEASKQLPIAEHTKQQPTS